MNIGFVGLGNMGAGMVVNLLSADVTVTGYDVDKQKVADLLNLGMIEASSVEEIAEACETVILCLPNPEASTDVITELTKSATVQTIIETSTLTPEIALQFAEKIASSNKKFLSAPMVGGKNSAINKTIHFLVEGDKQAFEENKQLFLQMGSRADHMGDIPSATLAKITFNLCRYANIAVAVEAYRLLQPYAPDMQAIYKFMTEQADDNFGQVWNEDMRQMMTQGIDFKPSQVPEKDLTLFAKIADENGIDPELINAVRNVYSSLDK